MVVYRIELGFVVLWTSLVTFLQSGKLPTVVLQFVNLGCYFIVGVLDTSVQALIFKCIGCVSLVEEAPQCFLYNFDVNIEFFQLFVTVL